jgi:hypothetical protein
MDAVTPDPGRSGVYGVCAWIHVLPVVVCVLLLLFG